MQLRLTDAAGSCAFNGDLIEGELLPAQAGALQEASEIELI